MKSRPWPAFTEAGVRVTPTRHRAASDIQDGRLYAMARWREPSGARVTRSLGWCTQREARDHAARLARGAPPRLATVADLLDRWIVAQEARADAGEIRPETLRGCRKDRRALLHLCGTLDPSTITTPTLADLATRIARSGAYAGTTADRLLVVLCGAVSWGQDRGMVDGRPPRWTRRSRPATAQRAQPEPEVAAGIAALPDDWRRLFVEVLRATGMRPGELALLTGADLQPIPGGLVLAVPDEPGAKTGARRVPLVDEPDLCRRLLDLVSAPDARIWPVSHPALAARRALAAAGVPWRLVSMRKTRSTELLAAGVPPKAYQAIMGHGFQLALAVYASADDDARVEAVRRVQRTR